MKRVLRRGRCRPSSLLLRTPFSLGDAVVLTAAIRDLHAAFPGEFSTGVESGHPDVFLANPYVTEVGPEAQVVDCGKVTLDRSGRKGHHYLQAYVDLFNRRLGTSIRLTEPRGNLHLSRLERRWYSEIYNFCGRELPYWVVCSGGKFDIPVKWWSQERFQAVVDRFRGKIQFVQTGAFGHHHPPLDGVIDLRGQTTTRDLINLLFHADGVLCGVTSLMHIAAAVPPRAGSRPAAVIVASGREPVSWERYPEHEFVTAAEGMACSPCWRNRIAILPDGPKENRASLRCPYVERELPACLNRVTSDQIVERIERLESAGRIRYLQPRWKPVARRAIEASRQESDFDQHNVTLLNSRAMVDQAAAELPACPADRFSGTGIVLCAGGARYFANAWVCIRMLRRHGCALPIQLWHLGRNEVDARMASLLEPFDVECVDALQHMHRHPLRNPMGWELKSYALVHSRYRNLLLLDADNVAVRDPSYLFETPQFAEQGAIFWPDYGRLARSRPIWKLTGIPYRDEPEFESGQIVVDKVRCWRPLQLALWINDHSEFFYQHVHGDKETFHLAWRKLGVPYAMPSRPIHTLPGTMCQHDFAGRRLFQHRNLKKWEFFKPNERIPGFRLERECRQYLDDLRAVWEGKISGRRETDHQWGVELRRDSWDAGIYASVVGRNEYELPETLPAGETILDIGAHIGSFARACHQRGARRILCYEPNAENFAFLRRNVAKLEGVRARHAAVLHLAGFVACHPLPLTAAGENTGGAAVQPAAAGVPSVALDDLLRREGKIGLMKLDCEGSEWPILLRSRELCRVQRICGEYHECPTHPSDPELAGPLDRHRLRALLAAHFAFVRIVPGAADARIGKFWASHQPWVTHERTG